MNEIINYTRLTTSDKLPDKFITCQSYIPSDKDQASLGQIFTELEIQSPWFPTNQVGQTIINTLIKEYYRGNNSSELINFEEAVKKVNESLAQTAQSGETEWIGKLSGVLVLINKDQIHIAQTGKSHSYLYRSNRVNHITEGLESEEAPHPLKTFSNLTSGSLQEDDKLIIANNAFFEVISPNELKLIIATMPPARAAIECARILQNHGAQEANAIFIEITSLEKLANLSPEEKIEAVYLDQQSLSFTGIGKNALSNVSSRLGSIFKHQADRFASGTKDLARRVVKKDSPPSEDDQIEETDQEETNETKLSRTGFFKNIQTFLFKLKNKSRRSLIHIGLYSRKKSKMYLVLLGAVLIILALTVTLTLNARKKSSQNKEAQQTYNQIVTLSGQADVLFGTNQTDAAIKYGEVLTLADKIKNTKFDSQAKEIVEKAKAKINEISKLIKIDPSKSTDLKDASNITLDDKNIYMIAENNLYLSSQDPFSPKKVATLGLTVKSLEFVPEINLLAGINDKKVVSFETTGEDLKKSTIEFKSPTALKSYGSNIYVSDSGANQIFKIGYEEKNFSKQNEYLKEKTDLSKINDFAIDGSLYTLSKSGLVVRYSRGTKIGEFQVSLPGSTDAEYLKLFAKEDFGEMLLLVKVRDETRLIKIKKSGELVRQYSLNGLQGEVRQVGINKSNDIAYVVNNGKIQEFKLN